MNKDNIPAIQQKLNEAANQEVRKDLIEMFHAFNNKVAQYKYCTNLSNIEVQGRVGQTNVMVKTNMYELLNQVRDQLITRFTPSACEERTKSFLSELETLSARIAELESTVQ